MTYIDGESITGPVAGSHAEPSRVDVTQDNEFTAQPRRRGRIDLVGAGPGDPELLTIAAFRAIQTADLVVTDRLVSEPILKLVKGRIKVAGKQPGRADEAQDELNAWVIDGLEQGLYVVRLKNGDPFLFGRAGEEILYFRERGFEPRVVPGVSSSLAAPSSARIPLTHRGIANQVLITTGRGRGGTIPALPPYSPERTTVFLMAVEHSKTLGAELMAIGYPGDCPAALVEKATCPEQRIVTCTVAEISEVVVREAVKAPATLIIGGVVRALDGVPVPEKRTVQNQMPVAIEALLRDYVSASDSPSILSVS